MIDIEKVQKVGNLAAELIKNGMASNSQEAMQQAEQMLSKKQEIPYNIPFSDEKHGYSAQGYGSSRSHNNNDNENGVDYNVIVRRFTMELNKHKAEVEELKQFVISLQNEMKLLKAERDNIVLRQRPVILEKEREKPQTMLKPEEKKSAPRTGGWQPGDISIEKFFYSGSKPK